MTTYYQHNANSFDWQREGDLIEPPSQPGAIQVHEATIAEDRAAFVWQWQRLTREDARAMLLLEGA